MFNNWEIQNRESGELVSPLLQEHEKGKGDSEEDGGADGVGGVAQEVDHDRGQGAIHSWWEPCPRDVPKEFLPTYI